MAFYVYIMANRRNGTVYTGQTDDLRRRAWEHRKGVLGGFTKQYGCTQLVWWEPHETREGALGRERQIKNWRRVWKLDLIEAVNPNWEDLYDRLNMELPF